MRNAAFIIPLLASVACAESEAQGPIRPDQIDESIADTICSIWRSCSNSFAPPFWDAYARSASVIECRTFVIRTYLSEYDTEAQIAAGELSFDAATFESCLAAARNRCSDLGADRCRRDLGGDARLGEACNPASCADGGYCETMGLPCPGVCAARAALGESCVDAECTRNAICSVEAGRICIPWTEVLHAGPGAPCGRIATNEAVTDTYCSAGLECIDDVCVAPLPLGAACGLGVTGRCAVGTACLSDEQIGATCRLVPLAKEGEDCEVDDELGPYCNTFAMLTCDEGKCRKWGTGVVGTFCDSSYGGCNAGLYCDNTTDNCAPKKQDGQSCHSDYECASGLCPYSGSGADTCYHRPDLCVEP